MLGFVCASNALRAQCSIDPVTGRQVCTSPDRGSAPAIDSSAHCRITVADGSTGSGTLVACDQSGGWVLTCSHLFDGSTARIVVAFPSGERFAANLIDRDRPHDLAALAIRRPDVKPLAVSDQEPGGILAACGFGSNGQFRCIRGATIGQALAAGATHPSLMIGGAVRPGDSGGGVLNTRGQIVGVVWGQRDGLTYATCGRPLREFLARLRGKQPTTSPQPQVPSPELDWRAWSDEMESRIRALDAKKQDKGEYLQPGDLNGYLRTADAPQFDTTQFARRTEMDGKLKALSARIAGGQVGFLQGLSWGKLAVGALGLSGPLAAAVIVAGGLAGRRVKSRVKSRESRARTVPALDSRTSTLDFQRIAVDSPPPPQRTVPETHYVPVEQDSFAKAHQWASEHVARKYPGATEVLQAQDSLIKQYLAAK